MPINYDSLIEYLEATTRQPANPQDAFFGQPRPTPPIRPPVTVRAPTNRCINCGRRANFEGDICQDCRANSTNCHECGAILYPYRECYVNGHNYCSDCYHGNMCNNCGGSCPTSALQNGLCNACAHPHEWEAGVFNNPNPTYTQISQRKFGVEIETSECPNYRTLHGGTIWECKPDCSIDGMEFISPVLYGDQGLFEIRSFCQQAVDLDFQVNRQCGLHIHLDMTNESEESLRRIAYGYAITYPYWLSFVPPWRRHNRFCGPPTYDPQGILTEDWDYFVAKRDRFDFVNWRAYFVHGSVEIRLYQGCLDGDKICNWLISHDKFINNVKTLDYTDIDEYARLLEESIHANRLTNPLDMVSLNS